MNTKASPPNSGANGTATTRPDENVWIIVAAFNEQQRLGNVLGHLCRTGYTVVVVDDGSHDETVDVAETFPVWVLRHPINCGQGAALQTGIDFALQRGAEVLVTFDADGQHASEEIARLTAPVRSGQADVALGSRFLGRAIRIPWTRWCLLKLAVLFTRVVSNIAVTDAHNGFRAFSRRAARTIRIRQPRMAHASEILEEIARHQLPFVEVPVTISYDDETLRKGQSAWGALRITRHLLVGRLLR